MALPSQEELRSLIADLNSVAKGYSTAPDLNGYMSRVEIITKAKKLTQALITPEQLPNYHGLNMTELVAIRTFMKLKVFEAIPLTGSISLQNLSKATGAQDSLLERMGRILVATGFLDQTLSDGGEYKHTKFSESYITTAPGPGHLFLVTYDEYFKNMGKFDEYLSFRGELSHATEPTDQLYSPYTWSHKQDGTPIWAIMAQNPEAIHTFQVGMRGIDAAIPVLGHFDFGCLKGDEGDEERVQLVDVGGGTGGCLRQILERYPQLDAKRVVLQDRDDVIELAKANGLLKEGVVPMAHDFLTPQPVKGAKAYFMRMITHDYSDPICIKILSRLAEAMAPDSRVLICDMVIPQRVGEADFPAAVLDQCVMAMGGKERTIDGFKGLFEGAGLKLVEVWRVPGVPGACVEARLKI